MRFAAIFLLVPMVAVAAPYELRMQQRDAKDTGNYVRSVPPVGPNTSGVLMYNGVTTMPQFGALGSGLAFDGKTLLINPSSIPSGPKGDKGDKGDKGERGEQGTAGVQGATGPQSIQGIQGATGVKGDAGTPGAPGAVGLTGPAGQTGPAGSIGPTGQTGPQGAQGIQGVKGDAGPTGPVGTISVAAPSARTVALATAYQCSNAARPCLITLTLQSQSSISLSGANNNEGAITVGAAATVAAGTGTTIATYKNNLGGGLVVGLNLNSQQANTYTVALPVGWYFAVRQTAGAGLQVLSAFDQSM